MTDKSKHNPENRDCPRTRWLQSDQHPGEWLQLYGSRIINRRPDAPPCTCKPVGDREDVLDMPDFLVRSKVEGKPAHPVADIRARFDFDYYNQLRKPLDALPVTREEQDIFDIGDLLSIVDELRKENERMSAGIRSAAEKMVADKDRHRKELEVAQADNERLECWIHEHGELGCPCDVDFEDFDAHSCGLAELLKEQVK